jgi:polyisoprenoid-binding protein YceI
MKFSGILYILATFTLWPDHFLHGVEFQFAPLGKSNRVEIGLKTSFSGGLIRGTFPRVKGSINLQVENPEKAKGLFQMDARSLHFGHYKVAGDAHSVDWLNSDTFPAISFTLHGLKKPRWNEKVLLATGYGHLQVKKKRVNFSIPLSIRYFRGQRRKIDGVHGDLLMLSGQSTVSRNQLGINPGFMMDAVMDKITIQVNLVGGSYKVRPFLPSDLFR